jgi:ACS family glucarate transporter-like MFS transporter
MSESHDSWDDFGPAPAGHGRSRARFKVLGFAVALAGVTYLDRVCISQLSEPIMGDLHLSEVQWGFVLNAFILSYALFEIPTGAWGDRIGTRRVLTRIVLWWSSFTIATAAAFSYGALLITRFLFGAGEAGAFPNVAKTFSRWFPVTERGTAQGLFFMGAHLGGGLTQILVAALRRIMPWRLIFVLFGLVGFAWAVAWHRWFRDDPAQHPAVNKEELMYIESGRRPESHDRLDAAAMRSLLTSPTLFALCLMYFTQAYGFYFNMTWLPRYLTQARGFSGIGVGVLAGLPLILSAFADVLGGLTTDRVTRRYGLRAGRCGVGAAALLVAGASLIVGATTDNALLSALLISLAGAAASFLLGACWGVCLDVAGPHAGIVSGCMNTAGQVGAVCSTAIFPLFLARTPKDWTTPLYITGALYLAGAACWLFIDPRRPIFGGRDEPPMNTYY